MPGEDNINEQKEDHGLNAENDGRELQGKEGEELAEELQQEIDAAENVEATKETLDKMAKQAKRNAYHFFVVHESTGKVEVLQSIQPGVVSYAFDPNRVTPRDLRYILEAIFEAAGIDDRSAVQIIIKPQAGIKRAEIWLDIRNRSDIEIGIMELWRYNK